MSMNVTTNPYIRNQSDCFKIALPTGLSIRELLGTENGASASMSVAMEEFAPNGCSPAHFHTIAEEYQYILGGQGKLVVGNQTKTVTKGDFVKIPPGLRHQTFNESAVEPLKLCCILTPSWAADDSNFEDIPPATEQNQEIYMRRKENCQEITAGKGEAIWEFLGTENGPRDHLSIALVEITEGCSSEAHIHPIAEECYVVLEGQGRLVIDGKTHIISCGDLAQITKGKVHQIFNDNKEILKFLCLCTPAWTPDCSKKV